MLNEKLSIAVLAYNHEKYIAKVLDGILAQDVNFNYKVYINDDASTDTTVKIIQSYQLRYPDKIKLFENKENKGQLTGIMNFLNNAKGEYLTLCDGDDYWINNNKLQTQLDFLDTHPEYIASCHDAEIISEVTENALELVSLQTKKQYKYISQFTTYRSNQIENWALLNGITYIQNCTLVWRKFDLKPYMHLFQSVKFNLDWIFNAVVSTQGKIQYINEAWAVYTDHTSGRTKNNYFFDYYLDKIKTLHQMKELPFFKPSYNRRHLYVLLAKQYNDLLEGASGGRKTKSMMNSFRLKFIYYSVLSIWVQQKYFKEKFGEMILR